MRVELADIDLALATGSHSGEPAHIERVRAMLATGGFAEDDLQCPPQLPIDEDAAHAVLAGGGGPARVLMNCSGKHAAMLATCVQAGWPVETYLDAQHPLQRSITATFAELTGAPVPMEGVDGCGAPLLGASLGGLARGFRSLAVASAGTLEHRIAESFRRFPTWASGTRRDEATLLAALPGAIGKAGAEGVYAVALPDGRTVALKIDDGAWRARTVVMAAALRRLGVVHAVLDELDSEPVLGGGRVVGEVRAVLPA